MLLTVTKELAQTAFDAIALHRPPEPFLHHHTKTVYGELILAPVDQKMSGPETPTMGLEPAELRRVSQPFVSSQSTWAHKPLQRPGIIQRCTDGERKAR